jgi:endonuclease YncB( thermonuclease family)
MRSYTFSVIFALLAGPSVAQVDVTKKSTVFTGPYQAEVVRIIDGDTIAVSVALWPGLRAEYSVRVQGIDAPEIFRPDCDEEHVWGHEARDQAERLYPIGSEVQLRDVSYDSFYGRVVAEVRRWRSDRYLSFAKEMVDRNLAVEWLPNQASVPWCLLAETR